MNKITITENAPIIRTDFSNQGAWDEIVEAVQEPPDPFMFNMTLLEAVTNKGATVAQLMKALPEDYPPSFIVVADAVSMSEPDHPLLVVDLLVEPGREFRALPSEIASIENNLSMANMDFVEFAEAVDENGVFRGFPGM